jgi:hypothetical protein
MPWLLEIVYIRDVRTYVSNRLEFLLGMGCPPQKLVTVSWNAGNFSLYPRRTKRGDASDHETDSEATGDR